MDRDERLKFCDVCTNRTFSSEKGLICNLTGEQASFELSCENYTPDTSAIERAEREELEATPKDLAGNPMDESTMNNLPMALIGGTAAMIVGAILWGLISVTTGYQVGYVAIAVGFLVGISVRFFGRGITLEYGIIGGAFAFLGTFLGNIFSIIALGAGELGTSYLGLFDFVSMGQIFEIYMENFSFMDLVFYAIAISSGFKVSLAIKG